MTGPSAKPEKRQADGSTPSLTTTLTCGNVRSVIIKVQAVVDVVSSSPLIEGGRPHNAQISRLAQASLGVGGVLEAATDRMDGSVVPSGSGGAAFGPASVRLSLSVAPDGA